MARPLHVTSKWIKAAALTLGGRWGGAVTASRPARGGGRLPMRAIGMVWRKPKPKQQAPGAMLAADKRPAGQPTLVRERLQARTEVLRERRIEQTRTMMAPGTASTGALTQLIAHHHLHLLPASDRSDAVGPGTPAPPLTAEGLRRRPWVAFTHRPDPPSGARRREQDILARATPSRLATSRVLRPRLGTGRGGALEGSALWRPPPAGVHGHTPASEADPVPVSVLHRAQIRPHGRPVATGSVPAVRAAARETTGQRSDPEAPATVWRARPRPSTREITAYRTGPEAAAMVWRARPRPSPAVQLPASSKAPPDTAAAARAPASTTVPATPARALNPRQAATPIPQLDPVIAERLAQDVVRRIERDMRIGRERRGI